MKVALIGTGLMGRPMAERLLGANYELVAFNRTHEKAEPLRALGADVAKSAHEAIQMSDCIISMLTDAPASRDVLFPKGLHPELSGRTVIQMGTISPTESMALNNEVSRVGGDYFEAPVLGSIPEAKSGKLIVTVGASSGQFDRWLDLLKCFGPNPVLVGKVGQAAGLKLAMNQLIASLTAAFALSLGFVQRKGIDRELFMEILRESALYASTFDRKLKRMVERDYSNPNFPTKHLAKDIDLFLTEAKSAHLETVGLEGVHTLIARTLDQGLIATDYSAIFDVVNPSDR